MDKLLGMGGICSTRRFRLSMMPLLYWQAIKLEEDCKRYYSVYSNTMYIRTQKC